jgi:hypothetical protein
VLLEVEYVLLERGPLVPEIATFVEIKFPTADARRGLGTGEFDESLGLSLTKPFGSGWTASAEAWYTFVCSPSSTRLDDSVGWLLGLGYDVTRALNLAAYVECAAAAKASAHRHLSLMSFHK